MNRRALAVLPLLLVVALSACGLEPDADRADESATEVRMKELRAEVGLPAIVNFTEARFARQINEMRDQAIRTWSYYVDMQGGRHLLCESVGYGLPYSVQLTNPEKYQYQGVALPQAEPNGLFMPESAEATWIMCSDGKGGVAPVYSETRLIVSPFQLGHKDAAESSGFDEEVTIQRIKGSVGVQGGK